MRSDAPDPGRGGARPARRSRRSRSPTAPCRGRSAGTPTCGTTSRRRWRCSSPAGSTRSTRAWAWVRRTQRPDGSWPLKIVGGVVEDASGETNMAAYVAVGVWHHWLVRRDAAFVRGALARAYAAPSTSCARLQLPFGGIAWSQEWHDGGPATVNREALLAGSSSIHHALRAGLTLADLLDDPQPDWELTAGRLGHALREHRDRFLRQVDVTRWTGTTRSSAAPSAARPAARWLASRWDDFVVPGLGRALRRHRPLGHRCRDLRAGAGPRRPGRPRRARAGCSPTCSTCGSRDGSYWTGYVYPDEVQLAGRAHHVHDRRGAAGRTTRSPRRRRGADVVRGAGLGARPRAARRLECGCASADALAGRA